MTITLNIDDGWLIVFSIFVLVNIIAHIWEIVLRHKTYKLNQEEIGCKQKRN